MNGLLKGLDNALLAGDEQDRVHGRGLRAVAGEHVADDGAVAARQQILIERADFLAFVDGEDSGMGEGKVADDLFGHFSDAREADNGTFAAEILRQLDGAHEIIDGDADVDDGNGN